MELLVPIQEETLEKLNLPDPSKGSVEALNSVFGYLARETYGQEVYEKLSENPDKLKKLLLGEKITIEEKSDKATKNHRLLLTKEEDELKIFASHYLIAERIGRNHANVSSLLNCLQATQTDIQAHMVENTTQGNRKFWRINKKHLAEHVIELFEELCYELGENEGRYLQYYLKNYFQPERYVKEIKNGKDKAYFFALLEELFRQVEMDLNALEMYQTEEEIFDEASEKTEFQELYTEEILQTLRKIRLWKRKTNPNFLPEKGNIGLRLEKLEKDATEFEDWELSALTSKESDIRKKFSRHDFSQN